MHVNYISPLNTPMIRFSERNCADVSFLPCASLIYDFLLPPSKNSAFLPSNLCLHSLISCRTIFDVSIAALIVGIAGI